MRILMALALWLATLPVMASLLPTQTYTPTITTPEQAFGQAVGQQHLRYDQVHHYLAQLAQQSDRAQLQHIGRSHEGRPQLALLLSSPENLANKEQILAERAQVRQGEAGDGPVVIWLAYSIHGDEASGLHAATLFAYYLAASQSDEVSQWLDNAVIAITPSQNPDGNDRFANWANGNRNAVASGDTWHREHRQGWPSGRVNHYLADLNRDWLYLVHPESRGRVAFFQQWLPHVVSDYHEMGHQSSYFFQPGVPDRTHPLTPVENQQLTAAIGKHHAAALDKLYQPYFSRESFDDFYYGKGSTYPDINGAVGILFEQASARGLVRDTDRGELTLSIGVRNHLATSFSTVRGALAEREQLRQYQAQFYREAMEEGEDRNGDGWFVSAQGDRNRLAAFAAILAQHQVQYSYLAQAVKRKSRQFAAGDLYIPFAQPQYRLLNALFDQRSEFANNTFYDVSAFSAELAFNLTVQGDTKPAQLQAQPPLVDSQLALPALHWHISWNDRMAPAALQQLLQQGFRVRFAESFSVLDGAGGDIEVAPGDLLILANQPGLTAALKTLEDRHQLRAQPVTSGQALAGFDPGGRRYHATAPAKVAVIAGEGTSQYDVGMLWFYLDKQLQLPLTLIDSSDIGLAPLNGYSHLFVLGGEHRYLTKKHASKIAAFVQQGGTVVAWRSGVNALLKRELFRADLLDGDDFEAEFAHAGDAVSFAQRRSEDARRTIGGAIVQLQLDNSHPLGFGLPPLLPLLKQGSYAIEAEQGRQLAKYHQQPLLSGFIAPELQQSLAGKGAVQLLPQGQGQYVLLADNPLFRNFWLGGERLIANTLFMVPYLR
ncbi:M14 family zinc carboxypeptidase [uncultured Ferrimonas sp.]|uniref:M14 family zinc carboxypeptidase n=1 Tax=uncultured Ferrimonas sp. TaxID=432640 RepID=UPI00262DCE9C|nr:M14 family zinc carboxypeptidase [uncultured Ferrimonas sp.]